MTREGLYVRQAAQYNTTLLLIASRASTSTSLRAPVRRLTLTFALPDASNCSYGPNGSPTLNYKHMVNLSDPLSCTLNAWLR